ncbi:MAG: hypothetical protein LUG98_04640, partial [Tannerellaceae bacterium]|nr:hypothetical protein [Tannerellaceae bacterium]
MQRKWINYWKYNLSDSLRTTIDREKQDHFEIKRWDLAVSRIDQREQVNRMIDREELRRNKKRGAYSPQSEKWVSLDCVDVLVAPFYLSPLPEHSVVSSV